MKERFHRFIAITFALFFSTSVAISQSEPRYEELPNFHQVNAHLYRGAQPKRGGIRRLAQLGIKTIVNLRANDERSRAEELEARAAGLNYFNVPFQRLGQPTDEQVQRVLSIINSTESQPVFVHCQRGADRTGTIIAIYRIEHDEWSSERAKAEANRHGMRLWQRGMKDFVRDYYRRRLLPTANLVAPGTAHYSDHIVSRFRSLI